MMRCSTVHLTQVLQQCLVSQMDMLPPSTPRPQPSWYEIPSQNFQFVLGAVVVLPFHHGVCCWASCTGPPALGYLSVLASGSRILCLPVALFVDVSSVLMYDKAGRRPCCEDQKAWCLGSEGLSPGSATSCLDDLEQIT